MAEKPADHKSTLSEGPDVRTSIAARMQSPESYHMGYRNNQILLVDDRPADVELAVSIAVAEDGEQALNYLFCRGLHESRNPADRPSVILLDLNLPKLDGLQVLKTLRAADERTRAIPIVILTSSKETKDVIAGYRLGASAFIQKPVEEMAALWLVRNEPRPAEAFAA
jgi:two-component system, response regulator